MKLADKISFLLQKWCAGSSDIVLPNYYFDRYEMDIMRLTKSGYIYEYEIKVTRSDYFADFKKSHKKVDWEAYKKVREAGKHTIHDVPYFTIEKHKQTIEGKRANRFFFVVPDGLVDVSECPDHAGLIYFKNNRFQVAKNAPLIHKTKRLSLAQLAYKLAFRELNWREKVNRLQKKTL